MGAACRPSCPALACSRIRGWTGCGLGCDSQSLTSHALALPPSAAENARLSSELDEARAALEMQHSVLQEQLQRILGEKEAQVQALQDALSDETR